MEKTPEQIQCELFNAVTKLEATTGLILSRETCLTHSHGADFEIVTTTGFKVGSLTLFYRDNEGWTVGVWSGIEFSMWQYILTPQRFEASFTNRWFAQNSPRI